MQEDSPDEEDNIKTEPVPNRRKSRSASQITSYSACGEAYRLERIERAPARPAAWFFQGTAFHLAIESWEESRRALSLEELEDIFVVEYRELANAAIEKQSGSLAAFMTGGNKKPETDLTDREALGIYQIEDYVRLARAEEEHWAVVANELYFEIEIYGVWVRGYIDQIVMNLKTGKVYPRDLKTGQNMPPTPIQLAIYALALQRVTAEHEAKADAEPLPWSSEDVLTTYAEWLKGGRPQSASGKTKAKPTEIIAIDLTDWGEERIAAWLLEMDRAEKADIYLPNPSDSCFRMCSVAQFCSVMGQHMPSVDQYKRPALPIAAVA